MLASLRIINLNEKNSFPEQKNSCTIIICTIIIFDIKIRINILIIQIKVKKLASSLMIHQSKRKCTVQYA